MSSLHDQLGDAVADVTVDVRSLAATSRRSGLARRRVRRSLATLGSAAAVAVLATGGWALAPGTAPEDDAGAAAAGSPVESATATTGAPTSSAPAGAEDPAALVSLDGRNASAVLLDLLGEHAGVGPGEVTGSSGQGGVDLVDEDGTLVMGASQEVYARLVRGGDRVVGINVQALDGLGLSTGCEDHVDMGCESVERPDGTVLRTYVDTTDKPGTTRLVAELLDPARDLRLVVSSAAPTGAASLGPEQVAAIVTDPVWGTQVPARYRTEGRALAGFEWSPEIAGTVVRENTD